MADIATTINQAFSRIDYSLAFIGVTMLLYFYGTDLVRHVVRRIEGSRVERFLVFSIMILFGLNIILVLLVDVIVSLSGGFKWLIIVGLNIWGFVLFDRDVGRK